MSKQCEKKQEHPKIWEQLVNNHVGPRLAKHSIEAMRCHDTVSCIFINVENGQTVLNRKGKREKIASIVVGTDRGMSRILN